ncbi:DASH complex subunit Spc34 [Calycina marina]|uniref:DASH complex subunit SPC34 n=1 Tax=Calycina marina TaxID=1763456 RepID=A0A9P7Z207_9HELO|nr:DASH complex subunit Spc34 [Calycina marina]
MALLARHLEQISLSAESIAMLPFPPPKIFTNAMLSTPDITTLIRDTEPHERALFSVPPPAAPPSSTQANPQSAKRRQTVFNVAGGEVVAGVTPGQRVPRRNTAVAAVLGSELYSEVQRKGEVDIDVLLRGAEKLNDVYPVAGVKTKIEVLRRRWGDCKGNLGHWEGKVKRLERNFGRMNGGCGWSGDEDEELEGKADEGEVITEEDLRREEEEIRELERRKAELEERVSGMERDLGGLLR